MTANYFVTGTDTDVGKTVLSALLVAALDGTYWKPIQTGKSEGTDSRTVMQWAGVSQDRIAPSRYCFDPPVSPHLAAERAGVRIRMDELDPPGVAQGRPLIAEGAGGVMVPINDSDLMLDLARRLSFSVVVASRTALGTINHTLLTVRALREVNVDLRGVVMIGPPNGDNERSIERYGGVRVIGRIPWLATINREALLQTYHSSFDRDVFQS